MRHRNVKDMADDILRVVQWCSRIFCGYAAAYLQIFASIETRQQCKVVSSIIIQVIYQSKRCMWLSSLYSTANSCRGVVMASHLNLIVCKDIKLRERIVCCLTALSRDYIRCASCYKKHIHFISKGSSYVFLGLLFPTSKSSQQRYFKVWSIEHLVW